MKKRIISLGAALALLLGCLYFCLDTNSVMAASDLKFDTTTGYITGYNGSALDVVIPSDIAGYTVRGIAENCFKGTKITSVQIPATVTEIQKEAFANCTALQTVTMPNQLTTIGERAFSGCSALKKIEVPYSVTSIGNEAFAKCTSLKKAVIPYSVTSIGESVFSGCTSLVSVAYQATDPVLPKSFCSGCISLSYFDIPSHITEIGQSAFEGCTSLQSISIPSKVATIAAYAYKNCTGLKNIYIPDTVSSVGYQTFAGCTGLKTAILDNEHFGRISGACEEERSETFLDCTNLTDVKILNNMTSLGSGSGKIFKGCKALLNITIPANVVTIPNETFEGCSPNLTIYCQQGSAAQTMALAVGIKHSLNPAPAFDNTAAPAIIAKDIDVSVNDMYLYFDQEPVAQNGRTLVPLRAIFEALGATVNWDGNTQTITAVKDDTTVTLQIGSDTMYKNGQPVKLDVPATAQNGRTLVPVRAISEAFNCKVEWNPGLYTVIITF